MKKPNNFDFAGWATKNNIRCADNRVIIKDAFKENDGAIVPLVWNHDHKSIENVLGHALLENRDEGVYAYCSFNETELGQKAKEMVKHGDIRSLSIYANQLRQQGDNVIHGMIREVSLVLAGANMGAYIDTVIAQSADIDEEAIVYHPYDDEFDFDIYHSEEGKNQMKEEQITETIKEEVEEKGQTVKEVYDSLTDVQKEVVDYIVGVAVEQAKQEVKHSDSDDDANAHNYENEGETEMKQNVFEGDIKNAVTEEMMHSAFTSINDDAKRHGSLKESYEAYCSNCEDAALAHSITDIGNLFPEYQAVNKTPNLIADNDGWVTKVMGAVRHIPFARIKSTEVNITGEEARAKGYAKGNKKLEEVVIALKRTTDPQTIYKKQALDRDDVIDITDFDVVAFLKQEMRFKLEEEIARAILVGDGRTALAADKIQPTHIRPVLGDNGVYTVARTLERTQGKTDIEFAKEFIKDAIKARKEYKGSGNPTLYCGEDMLANLLLIEDTQGHFIYKTVAELATVLRVKEIVTVPCMDNLVRTEDGYDYTFMGMIVNLADYAVGADKGGNVKMFDDFDIDYNKEKYLIETRCSGALVKPKAAITFEEKATHVG